MTLWAKVFRDRDGNRMIVPQYSWESPDILGSDRITPYERESEVLIDAMTFSVVLNLTMEPDAIEMPRDADGHIEIPHIATQLMSRRLEHGGVNVYIISGPMFDNATEVRDGRPGR